MLDLISFFLLSGITIAVVWLTFPTTPDIFAIIGFAFILIPTVIALVQGAPFVPTPMKAVKKMVKLSGVKKGENVVDIGCGDGRMVYVAANKYGANAIGYELSPLVYAYAKIRQLLWRSKAKIKFGDFRLFDLSKTDHIFTYMLPDTLKKFIPKFEKELKKGSKIVSYAFKVGDWIPIHKEPLSKDENISSIWVYEIGKHKKE